MRSGPIWISVFSYIAEMGGEENAKPILPVVGESSDDAQMMDVRQVMEIRDPMYCYTISVGLKPSHASHWVQDAEAIAHLLVTLTKGEAMSTWGGTSLSTLFT
jgi:hypothetical protein